MIKANTAMTNFFGAESIGGGLYPAELAECERRVREAKTKPRYCENPECRVLKRTGERQRLRGLNGVITERGAYRGIQPSRVCSWCSKAEPEPAELAEEEVQRKQCSRGHDLLAPGAYSGGRCKECKQSGERAGRLSHRDNYTDLPGLQAAKNKWGGTYTELARAIGYKPNTLKSWAYLTCAAPPEALEKLMGVLGCTAAELRAEAGEEG